MQYELDIETSAGYQACGLTDDDLDDEAEPLIRFLQKQSKPVKP
jgi:hypothetical protein